MIRGFFVLILATTKIAEKLAHALARPTTASRRAFVAGAAAATTSSAFFLPALAEPLSPLTPPPGSTAPLRPGGVARYNPEIYGDWKPAFSSGETTSIRTKLGRSRILADELSPLSPNLPFSDQELYYPPFLFGSWNVTATLQRKVYPYGSSYLPSKSLLNGSPRNREEQVGNTCSYTVHYFQNTNNKKILQDRAFNAKSISKAYQQLTPVQEVDWDYETNPTKVVLNFGAGLLTEDMMPLGPRRAEIFLTARQTDETTTTTTTTTSASSSTANTPASSSYCATERSRSVTLSPGNVVVADTEAVTEFHYDNDDDNHVMAVSRIAVFLSPNPNSREGILWQQVGGKAVAFFDYTLDMKRDERDSSSGSSGGVMNGREEGGRAPVCVETPKGVVQCQ